jgi:hypothetical protein
VSCQSTSHQSSVLFDSPAGRRSPQSVCSVARLHFDAPFAEKLAVAPFVVETMKKCAASVLLTRQTAPTCPARFTEIETW